MEYFRMFGVIYIVISLKMTGNKTPVIFVFVDIAQI